MTNIMTPPNGEEDGRHNRGGKDEHHQLGEEKNNGVKLSTLPAGGPTAPLIAAPTSTPPGDPCNPEEPSWEDYLRAVCAQPPATAFVFTSFEARPKQRVGVNPNPAVLHLDTPK